MPRRQACSHGHCFVTSAYRVPFAEGAPKKDAHARAFHWRAADGFKMGAEGSGVVVAVGPGVTLPLGQAVTFVGVLNFAPPSLPARALPARLNQHACLSGGQRLGAATQLLRHPWCGWRRHRSMPTMSHAPAPTQGAFTEYTVASASAVWPVPAASAEAAALAISGLTAALCLEYSGKMQASDTVLVTAAAGGTGHLAVQWAKLAGCHVVGTCGGGARAPRSKNECRPQQDSRQDSRQESR